MLSGVRVTTRATERKRTRRSSYSADPPLLAGDAASGSGVQRELPSIAPTPAPGSSTAALAAAAGLRIVREYANHAPTGEQARDAQQHGNPDFWGGGPAV